MIGLYLQKTCRRENNCTRLYCLIPVMIILLSLPYQVFPQSMEAGANQNKIFTVTIDPGHGGNAPGTVGKHSKEKELTLHIALKLGKYIENQMQDVKVVYTRKTDVFVALEERANIANRNNSDLFISIHVDGIKSSVPSGTSSYVMGYDKSSKNFDLVKQENKDIFLEEDYETTYGGIDPGSPEAYIGFSIFQNANLFQSLAFASLIQDQFRMNAGREDRGVWQAPFMVLWRTTMPSVLIETGFLTNPREEEFLTSEKGQDIIASSIYTAFRKYRLAQYQVDQVKPANSTPVKTSEIAELAEKTKDTITAVEEHGKATKDTLRVKIGIQQPKKDTKEIKEEAAVVTPVVASEIEFRVQVLASLKKLPSTSPDFKGKTGFAEFHIDGYYKYMTRPVKTHEEATALRKSLLPFFKGAFIVAYKDGKRISVDDAVKATR